MLERDFYKIYFNRDTDSLCRVDPRIATGIAAHWEGDFNGAITIYKDILATRGSNLPLYQQEFVLADKILVEVKLGLPFPIEYQFNQTKSASAQLIAHYARFYWGFWSKHSVARDSIKKLIPLAFKSECKDFILTVLFMAGHIQIIQTGNPIGYYLATAIHKLIYHLTLKKKWIKDFSKNIVFASYPYTQFVSGRMASIHETIEIGERHVSKKDPFYQCLMLISGLYGYAYGGNIAKTEISCQKFETLHKKGKLIRYAPISEIMRLLPFALRGYGHLVESQYLSLLEKFSSYNADPLINSQFHRACAVISLILGNNLKALQLIEIAEQERIKTDSFIAWKKFDRNIRFLASRNVPFDLSRDRLLNIDLEFKSPPQLGPFLIKLIELTPKSLEMGQEWLENEIQMLICKHIGIEKYLISRELTVSTSSNPAIMIGTLYLEFNSITDDQAIYVQEILSSLSAVVNYYLGNYQKLISAQKIEKDAAMVGLASEVAHNILASLDALDFELSTSDEDEEQQRIMRRNLVNRFKSLANGLLQKKKQHAGVTSGTDHSKESVEQISCLVDNIVTEKRVKYSIRQNIEIDWNLSGRFYSFFSRVNAPEYEAAVGNLIDNAVEALDPDLGSFQTIDVVMERQNSEIRVSVSDTGKGIPASIIERLGTKNFTYGKVNGGCYGFYHVKKTVTDLGGKLTILSTEGKGTTVTLSLPVASPPDWFENNIDFSRVQKIFVLDDDFAAHRMWESRFKENLELVSKTVHFYSASEFHDYMKSNELDMENSIFLFDYDLCAHAGHTPEQNKETGLDLINQYGLKNAYIVSSFFRDLSVSSKCLSSKVKIIPKNFIKNVPLILPANKSDKITVLIDDDSFIHSQWCLTNACKFFSYFTIEEFINDHDRFPKDSRIYVDSFLGNKIKGEIESKKIADLGFQEIYLTTSLPASEFGTLPHIKQIRSKEAPAF